MKISAKQKKQLFDQIFELKFLNKQAGHFQHANAFRPDPAQASSHPRRHAHPFIDSSIPTQKNARSKSGPNSARPSLHWMMATPTSPGRMPPTPFARRKRLWNTSNWLPAWTQSSLV
jgi:hypothetical protein